MNISKISNTNFGKFENWELHDNVKLTSRDRKTMNNISNYINEQGNYLKIYGLVGYFDTQKPTLKCIRLKTYPIREDMDILIMHRPNARSHDYMRKSKAFPINSRFLSESINDFLLRQYRYIAYCVDHTDHNVGFLPGKNDIIMDY